MITLFLCENSAFKAFEDARKDGFSLPDGCTAVKVPCAGSLKKSDILKQLEKKGSRVLILGCHSANCKFIYGNKRTSLRVESLKEDMAALDIGPKRLSMVSVSSVESARLVNLISDFLEEQQV